jgi:hypothetical protein
MCEAVLDAAAFLHLQLSDGPLKKESDNLENVCFYENYAGDKIKKKH